MHKPTALVWFKRDLRTRDHAPLACASNFDRALGLVLIEPEWLASPECDPRHVDYFLACVRALRDDLARLGLPLLVRVAGAVEALEQLRHRYGITHLLSHEETGPGWSYDRDRAVARWSRAQGVQWKEWPQNGVVRRLRTRAGWAARWTRRMNTAEAMLSAGFRAVPDATPDPVPSLRDLGLSASPRVPTSAAGERAAWDTLESFLSDRGRNYRQDISSPLRADTGGSRLSEHLAFGSISMRCVHQATQARIDGTSDRQLSYALRGFAARLRWHCHFIQKLEDEPEIEWRNMSRAFDGLRLGDGVHDEATEQERLAAWCEGRTGYPMVDACMRQLCATGWLNFRMRAMLVSFAANHLWLHWRKPGLFLARQFLDFEPGIHWSQMQMQSGTTGINAVRIYSPAKQARDHDPLGAYVRRWIPEFGSTSYPAPIVDERLALMHARDRLFAIRRSQPARDEAHAILEKHGSRKSGLPPSRKARSSTRPADDRQGSLF